MCNIEMFFTIRACRMRMPQRTLEWRACDTNASATYPMPAIPGLVLPDHPDVELAGFSPGLSGWR